MSNPCPAFANTNCDDCGEHIEEGDDVYFYENDKLCGECANDWNLVCECGSFKKPEFEECYNCSRG